MACKKKGGQRKGKANAEEILELEEDNTTRRRSGMTKIDEIHNTDDNNFKYMEDTTTKKTTKFTKKNRRRREKTIGNEDNQDTIEGQESDLEKTF